MARGLLDRLGERLDVRGDDLQAITSHLQALLNTRMGFAETAPGFGVVDFNSVVHTMPDSLSVLQRSIQEAVARYEPRLEQVRVLSIDSKDTLLLRFEIRARLRRSRHMIRLQTQVMPGGLFEVA